MIPTYENIPENLNRLPELAYNLWWSWTPEARTLFKKLDYPLWRSSKHNPVYMLQQVTPERWEECAADASFISRYKKVMLKFDKELTVDDGWFNTTYPELKENTVAYFSFEFGLHTSLPIYSGGLGILSGDHAKEASDLQLPFVGIGFMYPQGYFRQRIPSHGWQEAVYQQLDMDEAPILPAAGSDGNTLTIGVPMGDHTVYARVWQVRVGRVSLYLLDTDVEENSPWDRELSARLYSGDSETRIRQEIMLGVGGVRVLRALGINPAVWHMNEGHSAFLTLELIREKVEGGMAFDDALAQVKQQSAFTTHTPVPAGHDTFNFQMVENYFNGFWDRMGISRERFLGLGAHQEPWGMAFNMTVLAMHTANHINGVSELHAKVSREMWQEIWPETAVDDVPIMAITNGIHAPGWLASENAALFDKYLGKKWRREHDSEAIWDKMDDISDKRLWKQHVELKRKMLSFLRERTRRRWVAGQLDPTQAMTSGMLIDPDALTIGFARRFATYKRATLIFRDFNRLKRILLDTHRPVQLVFAGKSHPADDPGKSLIQQVYNWAKENQLGGRVAFIEDYDIQMARYLTQGVDVWLNTPRLPREASGTSGMKASLNGVPNLSILDGWWAEGYDGANGWAIGGEQFENEHEQDDYDANSLYELIENEIVPLYYTRDSDDIPRGWAMMMREAMRTNGPAFSMKRMVKEYTTKIYIPAME